MMVESDLTLDCGHTMQYSDHVLQKCTPDTYIILSTNVIPTTLTSNFFKRI